MKLKDSINSYLDNLIVLDKSKNTIDRYSWELKRFYEYVCLKHNCQPYINEITVRDLETFLDEVVPIDKYSSSSRHNVITAFKGLMSYCYRKGYIPNDISKEIRNIRVQTKERSVISENELNKLVEVIYNPTVRALLQTLYYTGLRISEAIKLKIEDVDLESEVIKVIEGKGKKNRIIPINKKLKPILKDYLKNYRNDMGEDNFFSTKSGSICRQFFNRELRKALKEAGINKQVTAHVMRHSFSTNLVKRKADLNKVQKLMGHSSIKTTGIYLHSDMRGLRKAVNIL